MNEIIALILVVGALILGIIATLATTADELVKIIKALRDKE